MEDEIKIYNIVIKHDKCWTSYSDKNYHDSLIWKDNTGGNLSALRYVFYNGNIKNLLKYIKSSYNFDRIKFSTSNIKNNYLLSMKVPYQDSSIKNIAMSGLTLIDAEVSEGKEFYYIAGTINSVKSLNEIIKNDHTIHITALKEIDNKYMFSYLPSRFLLNKLTFNELKILRISMQYGFFEKPRKTNMQQIADIAGISKSRVSTILRSSENKIFSILNDQDT